MKKNIKSQILTGYILILIVPIIISLVTVGFSVKIANDIKELNNFRQNQNLTAQAIVGHYSWIMGLGDTILLGKEFKGSLDSNTCGLGKWMSSVSPEDLQDPGIQDAINKLREPHNKIHTEASSVIDLSKKDKAAAYEIYNKEIKPEVNGIIDQISIVTKKYEYFAEVASDNLLANIIKMIVINIILVVLGVICAIIYGNRTSLRISKPVSIISDWSKRMAMGDTDLDFRELDSLNMDKENEICHMIEAFEEMATSVSKNVNVVKRVAQGDLTAFVEIRSAKDVLGRSLYRMVQENDHMFANVLVVASNVASSAYQVSVASNSLAQNTTEQAETIENISKSMYLVDQLNHENLSRVEMVKEAFKVIHEDVQDGSDKMTRLVDAVTDIKNASDKIYGVIKSIDDISTQTNLLALNASVEAARAGEAGKGFAVVADEVRALALKSAIAAGETKELIEISISKTAIGSKIASEASETFAKIADNVNSKMYITEEIAEAASRQSIASSQVSESVRSVSDIATSNSAISEESAAASEMMRENAEILKKEMEKFKLRQREYGKPYIPEEKKNDPEFIQIAEQNYRRAMERASHGQIIFEYE